MKRLVLLGMVAAAAFAANEPKITRASLATFERGLDQTIASIDVNDPYEVLGGTRGLYLPGYGVVFTTEASLVVTPLSPFHPQPDKAGIAKLREKKLKRMAAFREIMRQTLVNAAPTLDMVPASERVVVGVLLFYRNFEDKTGLPSQIVMQAPRQTLLDIKAGKANYSAIQIEEQ